MLKNDYWVQNLGGFMREGGVINGSRFGQPIHADKSNTRTLHTFTYVYTHASIAWAQDQTLSWRWYGDILWVSLLDWIPETKGLLVQTTKILHSTYIGGVH